ncbi:PatB family C-S lyase [Romboutsia sedimentorum]|uniref:cysteine-S-conjugate beta-lyase n=1 Tax=Romboutsia sedimentorum TaxID=1368474 RepID=A0ABT7EB98_9FIRM|nr:PatB family C-S lyase [Romboutsia sedimentorum]MDK2563226.1 PatB family C-S lyase [Romboutsia sedimentorum]MDK2584953.1 PatB family C-S lyase [Romboutsia sedimentorum]
MYSFDYKPDRVSEKCRKWDLNIIRAKFGDVSEDFIPMWIADMDFKIPTQVEKKFIDTIKRGVLGYTYCYDEFYDAVINWQRDMHDVEVKKEEITLTYGTVSTLHYTVQAFCKEGDSIILNTPVYDPFESSAKKQGVKVISNALDAVDNRYYINFKKLETQIKHHKPKLMMFCTPHNPSGRIWSIEEMNKVARICKENSVILVADEVHAEHIHYGKFNSILKIEDELLQNVILLTSPNKGFNIGGLKTSYSIIRNKELRDIFKARLQQNSITSPNVFGIIGLITSYNESRDWLTEVNKYIKQNYELLEKWINKYDNLSMMKMESSYLAWINICKLGISSKELTNKLALEVGVLLEEGSHFVNDGDNYIRINLGTQRENVIEALNRMDKFMSKLSK